MVSAASWSAAIRFVSLVGVGLSLYAYYVELKATADKEYRALCDINESISCTKVFTSPYGKGIGGLVGKYLGEQHFLNKPSGLLGIMIYSILTLLAGSNSMLITRLSTAIVVASNLASVYLAYILVYVLHDVCVVCISTYVVNLANLGLHYLKIRAIDGAASKKSKAE